MTRFEHKDDPVHFVAFFEIILGVGVTIMVLNITFNNISLISWRLAMLAISWRLVILVEETGLFGEKH
jgi:hypothetical protein